MSALREASLVSKVLAFQSRDQSVPLVDPRGRSVTPRKAESGDERASSSGPTGSPLNTSHSQKPEKITAVPHLTIATLFYLATLGKYLYKLYLSLAHPVTGGAEVVAMNDRIGNFLVGKE